MRSWKSWSLKALSGLMMFAVLIAAAVIAAASGEGCCTSPYNMILDVPPPTIVISPNPVLTGETVKVSGQNFTPNQTASLYGIPTEVYTENIDQNGNVTWHFIANAWWNGNQIYAMNGNYTTNMSNTVTLSIESGSPPMPPLNDAPPKPSPAMPEYMAFAALIATAAALMAVKGSKKK